MEVKWYTSTLGIIKGRERTSRPVFCSVRYLFIGLRLLLQGRSAKPKATPDIRIGL